MYEFHKWHKPEARKASREHQKWGRPVEGWVKCNFDGAWNNRSNRGGFGVVIRNHLVECLVAAIGPIERANSALHVEFFVARKVAVLVGTICTVEGKIQFDGDSALVLATMQGSGDDNSTLGPIISDLGCLLMEWSDSVVSHIQREGNSAAYQLAQMEINSAQEVMWFEEPLDLIQDILLGEGL
nr:uncharacterized protein LOC103443766 [Malus domestica]